LARRIASVALALIVVGVSGWAALAGMVFGFALKCDDHCGTGPGWDENPDAWQWNLLGWVGIGGFVLACAFAVAVALRRSGAAALALAAWTCGGIIFLNLIDTSGLTSHPGRGVLALGALVVLGVAAIALAWPNARRAWRE
jgi:hypothetical protein